MKQLIQLLDNIEKQDKQELHEGVRIGKPEMSELRRNLDNFLIGIEYEFLNDDKLLTNSQAEGLHHIYDEDIANNIINGYDIEGVYVSDGMSYASSSLIDYQGNGEFTVNISEGTKLVIEFESEQFFVIIDAERTSSDIEFYNFSKNPILDLEDMEKQLGYDTKNIFNALLELKNTITEIEAEDEEDSTEKLQNAAIKFFDDLNEEMANLDYTYNNFNQELIDYVYPGISKLYSDIIEGSDFTNETFSDDFDVSYDELSEEAKEFLDNIGMPFVEYVSNTDYSDLESPDYRSSYDLRRFLFQILSEGIFNESIKTFENEVIEETIEYILDENNIEYEKLLEEGSDKYEVVTEPMPVLEGLQHLKDMFQVMKEYNLETNDTCGLHISISHTKKDYDDFNVLKFALLSEMDFINTQRFEEREYVDNFMHNIRSEIKELLFAEFDKVGNVSVLYLTKLLHKGYNQKQIMDIFLDVAKGRANLLGKKHQSINFSDIDYHRGRIELRYFGGEEYETRYKDIEELLFRALYLLSIGFDNAHHKDYLKSIYRLVSKTLTEENVDIPTFIKFYTFVEDKFTTLDKSKEDNKQKLKDYLLRIASSKFKGDSIEIAEDIIEYHFTVH